ncbi:MAG: alginate lyase family protein [Patescibacteria group bacterium]
MKFLSRLNKALNLPLPAVLAYGKNALKKKFRTWKKVMLEKELQITSIKPTFPLLISGAHTANSHGGAKKILEHQFDLLGSGLKKLGSPIPWNRDFIHDFDFPQKLATKIAYDFSGGKDIKVPWELSRFQFLPALIKAYEINHDETYSQVARELISDWILKNPVTFGVNWKCTMDVAIRACNFTVAWYFLRDSKAWKTGSWQKTFLTSMVEHGKFIFTNLEYGPGFNSNHLLADITGLLFLGVLFPEFKEADAWKKKALHALETEMQKQVYQDGVDFEASIPYHRLVCEFFGLSALLAQSNGIQFSDDYLEKLEKMFEFVWHYTKPNGLAPQIGDNDDGRLFIFEDFFNWERRDHRYLLDLAKKLFPLNKKFDHTGRQKPSAAFVQAGIYIMRHDDFYCLIDAGTNGQNGNGGHAHNDTLSFELAVHGQDFIIDPGTYVYTSDPKARNKFRGTRMHNTVMIADEEMNRFRSDSLFSMHDDAQPKVNQWESNESHDFLDAEHNGYQRLKRPVTHHRTFELDKKKNEFKITDSFTGHGHHTLEWNFHFAPEVEVKKLDDKITATVKGKTLTIQLPHELGASAEIREDEVSPSYGVKEKAKVLTIQKEIWVSPKQEFVFQCIF